MMPTPNRFLASHRDIDFPVMLQQILDAGYQQQDMCRIIGRGQTSVSKWVSEKSPTPDTFDECWRLICLWFASQCFDQDDLISTLNKLPLK
jgi:hypothetical protein